MVSQALNVHLNTNQSLVINTSSIIVSLQRIPINALSNKTIQLNNNAQVTFPSTINLQVNADSSILVRCVLTPLAMADTNDQANTNLSVLLSVDLLDVDNNNIPMHTSAEDALELIIPRDVNYIAPPMILQNVSMIIASDIVNNRQFNLHYINFTQSDITVSVHLEMHPLNIILGYMFIYKFDDIPQLSSTVNRTDGWALLCPSNLTDDNLWTYFIDNQRTSQHNWIIYGIRELNSVELHTYCSNKSATPPITDRPFSFSADYELRMYTSGCYYLDSNDNWRSDGILVGPLTNSIRTQCFSTHLSTFAGGLLVLPSPINWNYVFSNADFLRNKTIYLTLIVIVIIYFILLIYARHRDKRDQTKHVVTFLADNRANDKYFYQLIVLTGIRKDAGTNSKVYLTLFGTDGETRACTLTSAHHKILQRGSTDSFILAVPKSLGRLKSMSFWLQSCENNSSNSWFLKYIIVRNLHTMKKSYFICQQWLTPNEADGPAERVLQVADNLEMRRWRFIFAKKVYYNMSDGHLWFSSFSRPPSKHFTGVQRCTCCFVLFYTVMLLNVLYYDQAQELRHHTPQNGFKLGPFIITREQIGIGIIVDILIVIPSTILVEFFRRIRTKPSIRPNSPVNLALTQLQSLPRSTITVSKKPKKKSEVSFSWWCLFIAYGLSFIIISVAIFFIIARGIEFGDVKCQKWLTSLVTGFFSSILLSQPFKIVCLVIFLIYLKRYKEGDDEAANFNW